jgi:hypothetical protein
MLYYDMNWRRPLSRLNYSHSPHSAAVASPKSRLHRKPSLHAKSERPIQDASPEVAALKAARRTTLRSKIAASRASQSHKSIVPTSPLFSVSSALLQKSAQLIENTRETPPRNSIYFYQFRTPLLSFPGSPVVSAFYELGTGVWVSKKFQT